MSETDGIDDVADEMADEALDTDDRVTPFAQWEVVETIKDRFRAKDRDVQRQLLNRYIGGERTDAGVDRRQFLKLLGFTMGGAVVASGTGWLMGKKVFSDYTDKTITGMQGGSPEQISASGQTITVGNGESYQNVEVDMSTGQGITIMINGSNSTIANIGFDGIYRGDGFIMSATAPAGEVLVDNIYLGDGATKEGASFVHGPGAIFYHKRASCDITFRNCNVQGYPNNGFYCSNTPDGGTVRWENCYGKNNGVSTYRCGDPGDEIVNCVAYNDDTDYGEGYGGYVEENGRPVWVWPPGGVTIRESEFAAGPYAGAIFTHQGATANVESGQVKGGTQGSVKMASSVGSSPELKVPDGTPTDARMASKGEGVDGPTAAGSGDPC